MRCAEKGYECRDYGWPPPRNPAPVTKNSDPSKYAGETRTSRPHGRYPSSQRRKSSTRGLQDKKNSTNGTIGYSVDNNQAYPQSLSTMYASPGRSSATMPPTRLEPRSQGQPHSAINPQQSPATMQSSGYNSIYASLNSSFDNSVPQADTWIYSQPLTPNQRGQGEGWYESGQQGQRSGQSRRFRPY